MPKRIIDGEGLWGSDKLALVQPVNFRAEFANLLALALANGVFECNPHRIYARVYAYNRPDMTPEIVATILNEYERVKLLFRWTDATTGKPWGYWVGIEKPGRLPGKSRWGTNEAIGPNPSEQDLLAFVNGSVAELHGIRTESTNGIHTDSRAGSDATTNGCLGFGSGLGSGKGFGKGSGDAAASAAPELHRASPVFAELLLNDGSQHPVTQREISDWERLYPAVDVPQQVRSMAGWCIANPRNRKTRTGIIKFIHSWLRREQDRAPRKDSRVPQSKPTRNNGFHHDGDDRKYTEGADIVYDNTAN